LNENRPVWRIPKAIPASKMGVVSRPQRTQSSIGLVEWGSVKTCRQNNQRKSS